MRPRPNVLAGICGISFASLLLELALTRLFSVVLFYHFAFMAISVALLGLGAGGLAAFLFAPGASPRRALDGVGEACVGSALGSLLVLWLVLHADVALSVSWANFGKLAALYFCAAIPFFCNGWVVARLMAEFAAGVHLLYFADLGGAAAACLLLVPAMNGLGAPSTVLLAAFVALVAAWLLVPPARRAIKTGCLAGLIVLAALAGLDRQGRYLDVQYAKGVKRERIEFKKWNSLSRIEVQREADGRKAILIDSDAATAIVGDSLAQARADPRVAKQFMRYSPALAYILRPGARALIIGAGGGFDIMRALLGGSNDVTAVEINPIIVHDLMEGRYRAYSHGLYELPQVHPVVGEGRSYVRQSRRRYGVVQATMVDTWASTAAGALALSESNLYTVEAFREYLRHLTDRGVVSITRWEFQQPREALRVVSLAMAALRQEYGVRDPGRYILVASDGRLNAYGVTVTTLIGRQPFSAADLRRAFAYAAAEPPLRILYAADMAPPPADASRPFFDLLASGDPTRFSAGYRFDVAPTTDAQPFFFYTLKTKAVLHDLWRRSAATEHAMDWKNNLALFVLLSLLLFATLAVFVFLLLPLRWRRVPIAAGGARWSLAYFVALGLGYILLEIACIQRFVLFLGHPTYALTVVVFVMLAASSLGSYWGRSHRQGAFIGWVLLAAATWILIYGAALTPWLGSWVGLARPFKIALGAVLLGPLAFLLGMPFPAGLSWLADRGENTIAWAWALNAAASVLGSVLAVFIGIHFGMNWTLAAAAAAYAAAWPLARRMAGRPTLAPAAPAWARAAE